MRIITRAEYEARIAEYLAENYPGSIMVHYARLREGEYRQYAAFKMG